jgi:S-adenosylmethionine synthetase
LGTQGASGILGTAVSNSFLSPSASQSGIFDVLRLSFSQTGNGLVPLDLTKKDEVDKVFKEFKPECL